MPPYNSERFRGKRAGAAICKHPTSNIECFRILSGISERGVPNANYFGDDRGPGERRLHPADSIAAWMS